MALKVKKAKIVSIASLVEAAVSTAVRTAAEIVIVVAVEMKIMTLSVVAMTVLVQRQ